MSIVSRPYTDESDYQRMRVLLQTIYALNGAPVYCTVGDLDWWRYTSDDPAAIRLAQLWLDGDDVVGIAWPSGTQVDLMAHPQHPELEGAMLAWAEQQRRTAATANEPLPFSVWSFAGDCARSAMLRERGYERTATAFSFKERHLDGTLPEHMLPSGYSIRHVQGDADVEQRVAVHRAAFAPSRMTVDKHRAVMYAPTYLAELDLIVVAPDGTFAAFCIVWFDEANQIGMFEPVGCHPDHQRRGLTKALLLEGFRRLRALDATTAHVNSWHDGAAANQLYESVRFQELDRNYKWVKQLSS